MATGSVEARKRELRVAARQVTVAPDDTAAAAAQSRILKLPEIAHARAVLLYAAASWEVPTGALCTALAERGVTLVFPRVIGSELGLFAADGLDDLVHGFQGIREPGPEAPAFATEEVDVFVVPGVLFDRRGHRLGRGGGHYDRLLSRCAEDACRVGLCYARRLVEDVPVSPWDVGVHVVVTETETIRVEGA
jgi:5-formyltetrahydrofolate cyclo-ligase